MTFIGVLSNNENSTIFKHLNNQLQKSIKVIDINKNSIENLQNIRFDLIILNYSISLELLKKNFLEKIFLNSKRILVNSDIEENLNLINNLNADVITYGFNNKATITVSSIDEDNIILCVQREIMLDNFCKLELQELKIPFKNRNIKTHEKIVISIIMEIYAKKSNFM